MTQSKYYLGFAASEDLEARLTAILTHWEKQKPSSMVPLMESYLERFVPELNQEFLVKTTKMLGLTSWAQKVINSAADVINKTSLMLASKMLKKRTNEEFENSIDFLKSIYVPGGENNHGITYVASEIDAETFARFEKLLADIDAGNNQVAKAELHELMPFIVDTLVDGFMKRSVNTVERSFVMRKLADGAMATCRAAGHGVVNKVFKDLDYDQYPIVAEYLRSRLVYTS